MKNKFSLYGLSGILVAMSLSSSTAFAAKSCRFELVPETPKIEFVGYKTTQKVGVTSTFKQFHVKTSKNAKSLKDLLKTAKFELDASSVESGNELRNTNLRDHFFTQIKKYQRINGSVQSVADGMITFNLNLNSISKPVSLDYTVTPADHTAGISSGSKMSRLEMKGVIDVLEFNLSSALASLNQVCMDLHKGSDGISKTWSTVNLIVKAQVEERCD